MKVRGQRVDLLEVEANLRGLPNVASAAVALLPSDQIAAYIVLFPQHSGSLGVDVGRALADLRAALVPLVAPYAIPALFLSCASLPLLASGKLDRQLLRRPLTDPANPAHAFYQSNFVGEAARGGEHGEMVDAPYGGWASATEKRLAGLWSTLGLIVTPPRYSNMPSIAGDGIKNTINKDEELTGLEESASEFFSSGGDSLRLVAIVSKATPKSSLVFSSSLSLSALQSLFFKKSHYFKITT